MKLWSTIENSHRVSSCSGRQFHGLMQVVTTRDPSKPARRLIGGSPGERAELVEGDHRFWIVWSVLVRSQPRRFLPPELYPERSLGARPK